MTWASFKLNTVSPLIHRARFAKLDLLRVLHGSHKTVPTKYGDIVVYTPNAKCFMRARSMLRKEPETTAWIDGFQAGDVYWDIGANIGQFALYAAAKPELTVLAFEPSLESIACLTRSIALNRMAAQAYCLGFDDVTACSRQRSTRMYQAGYSGTTIDESQRNDSQAVLSFTIDDFIEMFNPPFPNHIKIDTDGHETKILTGAKKTLADPRIRSICIEIGDRSPEPARILQAAGFMLEPSSETAKENRIFERPR